MTVRTAKQAFKALIMGLFLMGSQSFADEAPPGPGDSEPGTRVGFVCKHINEIFYWDVTHQGSHQFCWNKFQEMVDNGTIRIDKGGAADLCYVVHEPFN